MSWWRAVEQLKESLGAFVGGKPVENDDRSVTLVPLEGQARDVAEAIVKEITEGAPDAPAGEEPGCERLSRPSRGLR